MCFMLFCIFLGGGPSFEAQCSQINLTFTAGPAVKASTVLRVHVFLRFFSGKSAPPGNKNTFFYVFLHIPQYFGLRGTQDPSQEGPKTPPRGVAPKTVASCVPQCPGLPDLSYMQIQGYIYIYVQTYIHTQIYTHTHIYVFFKLNININIYIF